MKATGCVARSLNPSHKPKRLESLAISRKLGLLDGNLTGTLLPPDWRRLVVTKGHGLIYDVEWSASLWSATDSSDIEASAADIDTGKREDKPRL